MPMPATTRGPIRRCRRPSSASMGAVKTHRFRTLGGLSGVPRRVLCAGMNAIGMVEWRRKVAGKVTTETRIYIGSIGTDVGPSSGAFFLLRDTRFAA